MDIHLSAIGCRLNEAELENWATDFRRQGHRIVNEADEADLMVFNTCAVTSEAARKSRQLINRLHRQNPQARLVVSGCYVSLDDTSAKDMLGVDMVVSNRDKDRLARISQDVLGLPTMPLIAAEPDKTALFARNRQRAFVKIQDGCRYRCTFCVVTQARGEERSRSIEDIVYEVNRHSRSGIREIVLTGVHVGGFGSDQNQDLYTLVKTLLTDTDMARIRFASVEPWDLPDGFFDLFENPRLMPHMHLPLQSGSDAILRRMARRCKTTDYRALLTQIRDQVPNFNVSTDIIVGFPGESDQYWQETLAFAEEMRFSHTHIFSYSPRQGTKAASLPGPVDKDTKKRRSQELHQLAAQMKSDILRANLDDRHEVLWESPQRTETPGLVRYAGYTCNYLRVETEVPHDVLLENTLTPFTPERLSEDGQLLLGRASAA
ncbi:MAG TPA: tRNA (N(6)-L-threonylcarbamoyladenosine(37)-C(2))-methylthiotransferase MtaB [Gammaproteobacteria bacterium]|nr:tRNA (N(6)-L-threonylcarbamoyladenosine(37)-C(2))-methylthiotransferase MtaB [Gammaproteobacteria bacterium]